MRKILIMALVRLRWAYFHMHPWYFKFYMDSDGKEAHFQHAKTGQIHSNLVWIDNPKLNKADVMKRYLFVPRYSIFMLFACTIASLCIHHSQHFLAIAIVCVAAAMDMFLERKTQN